MGKRSIGFLLAGVVMGVAAFGAQADDQPKALVVYGYLGDPSLVRMHKASLTEAKKIADIQVDVLAAPDRDDANFLSATVERAVAERYNAIAIRAGDDGAALLPALEGAQTKGLRIIAFDEALPELKGHASDIVFDLYGAGRRAGELFGSWVSGGAKIGIIRCRRGRINSNAAIDGFRKATEDAKYVVVMDADAKCDPALAQTITAAMLKATPDLGGVFNVFDVSAQGSLQALQAAKSTAALASIGGQLYACDAINARTNWAISVTYPFEALGAAAVDAAAKAAKGEAVEASLVLPVTKALTTENAKAYASWINARLAE